MIPQKYTKYFPFLKYSIVGTIGTVIDLGSLYIFVEYFKFPLLFAVTLSFILAVLNNFILNKIWTFKNKSKNIRKLFIKFLLVSLVGLALTDGLMLLLTNILGLWYMLSKLLTSGVVLTWNFFANKIWTFKIATQKHIKNRESKFDLSIIVPAYNEENRITETIKKISAYIIEKKLDAEIIIVNDGSKDKTENVIKQIEKEKTLVRIISYSQNRGKGFAVKTGGLSALGKKILFTDADNSTPIEELEKLLKTMNETSAEIVIGSRHLNKSSVKIAQGTLRKIIGKVGNFLIQILVLRGIKDTQCGFKLFTRDSAKTIFQMQKIDRWGFDIEILSIAKKLKYKIKEVPVSWFNDAESKLNPIRDALRTLKELLYIKFNLLTGRYNIEE